MAEPMAPAETLFVPAVILPRAQYRTYVPESSFGPQKCGNPAREDGNLSYPYFGRGVSYCAVFTKENERKQTMAINTLTRWEPFREMEDFQNRLSTLFGRPLRRTNGREEITLPEWTPLADITEDEKEYRIKAELPEMKKEEVKVTVENGVLTISGERKFEKEEKKRKYHRVERGYGTFMRSFTLPDDADFNHVNAEFKNGLLTVHVPKSEHAKPKEIEVKVA
jgi:HSP20 family protein